MQLQSHMHDRDGVWEGAYDADDVCSKSLLKLGKEQKKKCAHSTSQIWTEGEPDKIAFSRQTLSATRRAKPCKENLLIKVRIRGKPGPPLTLRDEIHRTKGITGRTRSFQGNYGASAFFVRG